MLNEPKELDNSIFKNQIESIFPSCAAPKSTSHVQVQGEFTNKCDQLTDELAELSFSQCPITQDAYNKYLRILTEILSCDLSNLYFPFSTFSSKWIPGQLNILIKMFPRSEMHTKCFELAEILSRDSACSIQFCSRDFIPLTIEHLTYLINQTNYNENSKIIISFLIILSNIFYNTDNGMDKYSFNIICFIFEHFNKIENDFIVEHFLLLMSNMLKYHQYFSKKNLIDIATFFVNFIRIDLRPPHSRSLFILHKVIEIDISKETLFLIVNPSTTPILIRMISNPSSKIKISSILILISFLKKSDNEYKAVLYKELSWEWFKSVWLNNKEDCRKFLIKLFYYLVYYNFSILKSALDENVFHLLLNSFENSSYEMHQIMSQNLIGLSLLKNIELLAFLINNNFLQILDEFLAINDKVMIPFILDFYLYLFEALEKGQIKIDCLDFDKLEEQLYGIKEVKNYSLRTKLQNVLKKLDVICEEI